MGSTRPWYRLAAQVRVLTVYVRSIYVRYWSHTTNVWSARLTTPIADWLALGKRQNVQVWAWAVARGIQNLVSHAPINFREGAIVCIC